MTIIYLLILSLLALPVLQARLAEREALGPGRLFLNT